jgi:hypothetical protein
LDLLPLRHGGRRLDRRARDAVGNRLNSLAPAPQVGWRQYRCAANRDSRDQRHLEQGDTRQH